MAISDLKRKVFHYLNKQTIREINNTTKINMSYPFGPTSDICDASKDEGTFSKIENDKLIFHCYWYGPIGRMQVASINSLLATQKSYDFELWLWLDNDTAELNDDNNPWINKIKDKVCIKYYSPSMVKEFSYFDKVYYLFDEKDILPFRADGFRMWALHKYGGFYFDLDIMFLRDMKQLIWGSEFVYSWEKQVYANNAIIYLRKNSYLNNYLARKVSKKHSTQPWKLFDYKDKKLNSLLLLPSSTFDPIWNVANHDYMIDSFDEFFTKEVNIEDINLIFPNSFGYHWHNNWKADINESSLFAVLERINEQ